MVCSLDERLRLVARPVAAGAVSDLAPLGPKYRRKLVVPGLWFGVVVKFLPAPWRAPGGGHNRAGIRPGGRCAHGWPVPDAGWKSTFTAVRQRRPQGAPVVNLPAPRSALILATLLAASTLAVGPAAATHHHQHSGTIAGVRVWAVDGETPCEGPTTSGLRTHGCRFHCPQSWARTSLTSTSSPPTTGPGFDAVLTTRW